MEAIFCSGEKPNASHFLTALSFSVGFLGARFLLDNLVFKCITPAVLEYLAKGFPELGLSSSPCMMQSDVFLETAKVFKYSEKEMGASVCFGLFALSWLVLQLIIFPFWVINASRYQSIESLMVMGKFPTGLYYIFNTMLLMLLVFHVYWWKLICAMVMRQMSNKGQVGVERIFDQIQKMTDVRPFLVLE